MKTLEISGSILAVASYTTIALGLQIVGFSIGLASCIALIWYFYHTKQVPLYLYQTVFLVINGFGLTRIFYG